MRKGSFAIGEYVTQESMDDLQLMTTDIYYEYSLAMTWKTWPLKDNLDELILNVVQSGMQRFWEGQVYYVKYILCFIYLLLWKIYCTIISI